MCFQQSAMICDRAECQSRATGNHPDLTWSDQGKALLCSEPTEGESSPVPSSIDPAIVRDPDTGDAWLSFGGGHIYTVKGLCTK